jgi:hypothetical protein
MRYRRVPAIGSMADLHSVCSQTALVSPVPRADL